MSGAETLDLYPALQPGVDLHLHPKGGTLFVDGTPRPLSPEESEFLRQCDGRHKAGDILPSIWRGEHADIQFLALVAQLLRGGFLRLLSAEGPSSFRVTGSVAAYIPPHMSIEVTAGCNLQCRHCYRESQGAHDAMPIAILLDLLHRLRGAGLRAVELTGGEPLVHPDFGRILALCGEEFELVGVLSNGTILTEALARQFASLGSRLVLSISLDASTAAAHDLRRGQGAFHRTVRSIQRLCSLGVKVRVAMCVDEDTFSDIESTLLLARSLGAFAFSYTPVLPFGRASRSFPSSWTLDRGKVMRAELELKDRYLGFLALLPQDVLCALEDGQGCGAGHRTYVMDPWGCVRPCPTFASDSLVIGDLSRQSIEEVFGSPVAVAMAELPVPNSKVCGECPHTLFCRYCALRGFYTSRQATECGWLRLPAVQRLLQYGWPEPGSGSQGPMETRPSRRA